MIKKLFATFIVFLLLAALGLVVYGWFLSTKIEKRFSARRWQIPSTVFSDTTLLYPGQRFGPNDLRAKLHNLGYRPVAYRPNRKGTMRLSPPLVDIYLNDLVMPPQTRPGFRVRIRYDGNRIESIERIDRHAFLSILELEPEEIGKYYGPERERRQLVSFDQIPDHLIHAVLAAEDSRFYEHPGFDALGILRAVFVNLIHGSIRQGGSTITQQLTKNYFLTPERTLTRKFNELMMAVVIEFNYDKNEILEIYLNEIYLGQKGSVAINGIGEASYFYFGKSVGDISLTEAAALAGLIKSPGHYSPFVDKARCLKRRNAVLHSMNDRQWITADQLRQSLQQPLQVTGSFTPTKQAPYFLDYLTRQLETLYPHEDLVSLGLSIYTTLDTRVQAAAERALMKGLARLEKSKPALRRKDPSEKLQGAIVVMRPKTGYILAMVGGRDYGVSQYNRVIQSRRQPGSVYKPFVYLAALDAFTPASRLSNAPRTYMVDGRPWEPQNVSPELDLDVSLRTALKKSHNRATVDLAMQVGLDRLVAQAGQFGFTTPFKAFPSLALGAFEVIPLELARAYCTFAADGILPYPLSLKDVVAEDGRILKQAHTSIKRLISPEKTFIITDILKSVVTDGTARALSRWKFSDPIAGKTGTTSNYRDAWFVGYTPNILALVWVGFDNGDSILATGASAALPIWADLMAAVPQYASGGAARIPPGVVTLSVCSESGLLTTGATCPEPIQEYFLQDLVPVDTCPLHQQQGQFEKIWDGIKGIFKKE